MVPTRHISRFIPRPVGDVVAFASNPKNLPKWAEGISDKVTVRFVPPNEHGILDHYVTADGKTFYNPMRVFENDGGSEVVFTLFRMPGVTDEAYEKDAQTIATDLERLERSISRGDT